MMAELTCPTCCDELGVRPPADVPATNHRCPLCGETWPTLLVAAAGDESGSARVMSQWSRAGEVTSTVLLIAAVVVVVTGLITGWPYAVDVALVLTGVWVGGALGAALWRRARQ